MICIFPLTSRLPRRKLHPKTAKCRGASVELWGTAQTARYLGMHPETLREKTRRGEVPTLRVGGRWKYRQADLDEWLAQGCPKQEREPSLFDHANR